MTAGPDLQLHLRKPAVDVVTQTKQNGLPEIKDKHSNLFVSYFKKLPSSTRTVLKRVTFSLVLLSYFLFIIYGGPVAIMLSTLAAQIKCFDEIITIGYKMYDIKQSSTFRYIPIYFLISANFYFGGENILVYFDPFISTVGPLRTLVNYHRFISFCSYFIGVMWFVLSLKKKQYRKQFALLAWTHLILLIVVVQSHLIAKTIFQGMIWFVICITTVTCNDIMAYICGKLIGKTPLIQLSPKKTREGFIGAAISTVIISCVVAYYLCGNNYFVCPIEYREINGEILRITQCNPDYMFKLQLYDLKAFKIEMYPFVFHTFWLSVFGSLVAPFGGFFASGFKRAFKVKDFGDIIPGHGGLMDRFDCQLVMVTFVNVYISSFATTGISSQEQPQSIFDKVMNMHSKDQLELYYLLKGNLLLNGYELA